MSEKDFYTVKEAAKILGILPDSLADQIRNNKLKAEKFLNAYIIPKAELARYMEERGIKLIEV